MIVDGHAHAYRAFFAIRELAAPSGAPVNAIYGFARTVNRLAQAIEPTHVFVAWDGGLARERMALWKDYKAGRPSMPEALEAQLDGMGEYLKASGYMSWMRDGVEADDAIARAALAGAAAGARVWIASSDKDFMQLVSDEVRLLIPGMTSGETLGPDGVKAKTGVNPTQIVDWLSMTGDKVDNIPGAPGIGPKTAAQLLQQHNSVEQIYQRLALVEPERIRKALAGAGETVRRNQSLIRLTPEAAGELSFEEFRTRPVDADALRALYSKWGFRSLLREAGGRDGECGDLFAGADLGRAREVEGENMPAVAAGAGWPMSKDCIDKLKPSC